MAPFFKPLALGLALALAACAMAENRPEQHERPRRPDGLAGPARAAAARARPPPSPTATDPLQVVDLWLPEGDGPASDRAHGPWRLLADRNRRPPYHELDRRRPQAARHRRLEHRLSRRRPARRRLSRHLPGRRRRRRRAARPCRRATSSISRASSPPATAPAAISRSGWPPGRACPQDSPLRTAEPAADPRRGQPRRPARSRGSGAAARQRLRHRGDRDGISRRPLRRNLGPAPRPARRSRRC